MHMMCKLQGVITSMMQDIKGARANLTRQF